MISARTSGYSYDAAPSLFTGKERDAETGLDSFGARYFSGAQGRFTSPDELLVAQNVADPQSWNFLSSVRNNLLTISDQRRSLRGASHSSMRPAAGTMGNILRKRGLAAPVEAL